MPEPKEEVRFPVQTSAEIMDSAFAEFQADLKMGSEEPEPEPEEETLETPESGEGEEPEEAPEDSEDAEEESDEEDSEEDSEEEDEELPSKITVKADGKNVTIDFTDRDHITRVYQKYVAQARYQKERDEYKSQLEARDAPDSQQSKDRAMVELLNEHIEDPKEMFRLFTGGKNLEAEFEVWQQERDKFSEMSDEEQKSYLNAQKQEAKQKELDRREAALNSQVEESEAKRSSAEKAEQASLLTSAFEQYRFNEITDEDEAQDMDSELWEKVQLRLSKYEEVNKEIIVREMKDAADKMRRVLNRHSRVEAKKQTTEKKKKAKKAVAKAVAVEKEPEPTSFLDGLAAAVRG